MTSSYLGGMPLQRIEWAALPTGSQNWRVRIRGDYWQSRFLSRAFKTEWACIEDGPPNLDF